MPEAFEGLHLFAGNRVTLGMGDVLRPQAHLPQLVAEPEGNDNLMGSSYATSLSARLGRWTISLTSHAL
jgi:hypothetical protein